MRAIICESPNKLMLGDRPEPAPGADDALVRIRRVGLCGTDFHIYAGRHPFLAYPRVMGHELAGEILVAPPGSGFAPGQSVAINPYLACGTCLACRHGKPNACAAIQVLGVHIDGGMCERLAVPVRNLIDATGLSLDEAAMLEFLAVGAHAVARAAPSPGARVLVVGAGPIGVATALFARRDGAEVTLVDQRAARLDYARTRLGFDTVLPAGADLLDRLAAATGGEFFDIVFDASGSIPAMNEALRYVGHGGALVFVGVSPGTLLFDDPELHKRETTVLASRNALSRDFDRVAAAFRAGTLKAEDLRTHELALETLPTALPALIAAADHVLKAVARV
ncbi:zinc-binding alcohol dehydrogenase family protein [Sphingomonas morindae]|uniref:Zinc-binding alcohol dehydrogenase family protein n=1 Tax=Sphingomonas morindae TaxID=1541170 RepID=A0ABY4XD72_9SPHN|nr:zinc-binding alcohol dehydrogenase family protein [Sphingomonas morindae]USI74863.1 zinc-binding alcohol dehydrogenase family protein [Sphingomonas morindae]